VVSRFWNPLGPIPSDPPGGFRLLKVDPNDTAKASVIRWENSPDISRCLTDGSSVGDSRKRQLVVDAGIVDAERCRKEAVADYFMGGAFT